MRLSLINFAKVKGKHVLVLMESMSGSGHGFAHKRERLADKAELYRYDPLVQSWVIYREKKKIRTFKAT